MNDAAPHSISPHAFIEKWKSAELKERSASQSHFNDLCSLLGEKSPIDADSTGDWFTFEKGAMKTGGGAGWADVWKRGCFAWEYKGNHADLDKAFAQLQRYAIALENPPLLIVSDMRRIIIHTNWTNTVQETHEIGIDELVDARRRQPLKWAFSETEVEQLRPRKTRQDLTKEVAEGFARLALHLRERDNEAERVAHFVNRLVFCMFAEDVDLLPKKMFTRMLELSLSEPEQFEEICRPLFAGMRTGGRVGMEKVEWFNGGLFDSDDTLKLTREDIKLVLDVARMDWSNIDPSIMGTLFERGLDPDKRSQLGAHYTDRDKIMLIVNPVIVDPITREWEAAKADIAASMESEKSAEAAIAAIQEQARHAFASGEGKAGEEARRSKISGLKTKATKARAAAEAAYESFLDGLNAFRVLDPACGSGNFLYLSLLALKDIEHRANLDAEALGLKRKAPRVGPHCVKGIEINPFAAELARVSVWIGEIQWMKRNGFDAARNPILKPLETIECRDALLNADGTEAEWPAADVIVGNPPFLGGKLLITYLGEAYVTRMFRAFDGAVPREADLVTYWFDKAAKQIAAGDADRAGLVATNSIRGGANRRVLKIVQSAASIYDAWDDEPWIVDGAAVRVALVSFSRADDTLPVRLDGAPVSEIYSDLTAGKASGVDLTRAARLHENRDVSFQGVKFGGPFEISEQEALSLLLQPLNPNLRPNSDVLRLWCNGMDVTRRRERRWCIDFGISRTEGDATLFEGPYAALKSSFDQEDQRRIAEGERQLRGRETRALANWWLHQRARGEMRRKVGAFSRMIVTPEISKHRLFMFFETHCLTSGSIYSIARDDDTTFGILHSRFHELWSLRMGTSLEDRPRYTPTTCFETFPFPEGLTPDIPAADYADDPRAIAIAEAARRLNELRENWLNPEDLVERVPEVVPGYPDRIVPVDDKAAAILKKRTLTNLYNERPAWLDHAHRDLDAAVAAAYGWPADLSDDAILERLFHLNQARAAAQSSG